MKYILRLMSTALLVASSTIFLAAQVTETDIPQWKLEPGFSYSRGDYGLASDTEVFSVPVTLSVETPRVIVRGSTAWMTVKGPATVTADSGIPLRPGTSKKSGLGDFSGSFTYKLANEPGQWNASTTGRIKFPTGEVNSGLSTGEFDYYAQVDLLRTYGSITPFLTGGYRWLGDSAAFQLRDGPFAAAGLAFPVSPRTTLAFSGEWRRAIVSGGDQAEEASLSLFHQADRWTVSLNAMTGFTDASPDFGGGFTAGFAF